MILLHSTKVSRFCCKASNLWSGDFEFKSQLCHSHLWKSYRAQGSLFNTSIQTGFRILLTVTSEKGKHGSSALWVKSMVIFWLPRTEKDS